MEVCKQESTRKGGKLNTNFESMKSHLLQVIEELKMRRKNDAENEEKINVLITEKFEYKKIKEEEISKLYEHIQSLKQENIQLQKVFEEKKKVHEEEKAAQSMTITSSSKGISSLKDEILTLQLSKFALEKKLKDMEHQLQVEMTSKNELVHRIKDVDKTTDALRHEYKQLAVRLDYLANIVVKTEAMQKKLIQLNEHQKLLLSNQQKEMMKCQKEMSVKAALLKKLQQRESNVTKRNQFVEMEESGGVESNESVNLKIQLEKELESMKIQKKFLMTSLSETNQLLMSIQNKYDQSNNLNASLQMDIEELKATQMECASKYQTSMEEGELLNKKLKAEHERQNNERKQFEKTIQQYESKLTALQLESKRMRSVDVADKQIQVTEIIESNNIVGTHTDIAVISPEITHKSQEITEEFQEITEKSQEISEKSQDVSEKSPEIIEIIESEKNTLNENQILKNSNTLKIYDENIVMEEETVVDNNVSTSLRDKESSNELPPYKNFLKTNSEIDSTNSKRSIETLTLECNRDDNPTKYLPRGNLLEQKFCGDHQTCYSQPLTSDQSKDIIDFCSQPRGNKIRKKMT